MRKQLDADVESQVQGLVVKYNKLQAPLMQQVEIINTNFFANLQTS